MLLDKTTIKKIPHWLELLKQDGGAILINKEKDWTSFDVIAKLRNLLKMKKLGHAGTLDPLAEGLLIVCAGRYTKKIEEYQDLAKEYIGTIKFGATTKTDDSEAEEENIKNTDNLEISDISYAFSRFHGKIEQIPPKFSAKKVNGERAYKLARKNVDFELNAKEVEIYSLNLLNIKLPFVEFKVQCSKGTYIRALARDIGELLKTGAYLSKLERTKIGNFSVDNALKINDVSESIN